MVVLARHLFRIDALLLWRLIIFIKVAGIGRMSEFWNDWTFDFAVVQGFPVNGAEERVRFDAVDAAGKVAEALCWVHGAESRDEGASVRVHVGRIFDFAYADSVAKRCTISSGLGHSGV